jgi:hypothetical protein
VRMEVVIGGTWIRPIDDGKSTEYTVMCLTNPGGAAETAVGSALVNRWVLTSLSRTQMPRDLNNTRILKCAADARQGPEP